MRIEVAFGDSAFDLPMLGAARCAVAIRPKPGLLARANECPGLLELASGEPAFASVHASQ
jgi:phosphoserine phosphatase